MKTFKETYEIFLKQGIADGRSIKEIEQMICVLAVGVLIGKDSSTKPGATLTTDAGKVDLRINAHPVTLERLRRTLDDSKLK